MIVDENYAILLQSRIIHDLKNIKLCVHEPRVTAFMGLPDRVKASCFRGSRFTPCVEDSRWR